MMFLLALAGGLPYYVEAQRQRIPFGGVKDSGTGSRVGSAQANMDAFTNTQRVTLRRAMPTYPF